MDKIIKNPLKHVKTKETLKYEQAKNNYQKLFERVKVIIYELKIFRYSDGLDDLNTFFIHK